jgi:DNA polymerase III subunit gamma/tau
VPETVVSRCQSYTFKMPPKDALKKFVIEVAQKEGKAIDAPSAELIALFGDGSFRDTLVMLQKVLTSVGKGKVDAKEVAVLIGAPPFELVNALLSAAAEGNVAGGLEALAKASDENIDMKVFLKLVLEKMRGVMYLRFAPNMKARLAEEFTPDDLVLLEKYAGSAGKSLNSKSLAEFLGAYNMIGYAAVPSLPIELALIRVCGEKAGQDTLL